MVDDHLVMILRRFRPDTLRDARALDAALRSVPESVPISDIHALTAAVYSGAADELVARVSSGQLPLFALDDVADRVARVSGMNSDQARRACAALGIAFGVLPDQVDERVRTSEGVRTGPPDPSVPESDNSATAPAMAMTAPAPGPQYGSGVPQVDQPSWDRWWGTTPPPVPPVAEQRPVGPRRFWLVVLGVLLVGGLVAATVLWIRRSPEPPPPLPLDVFSLEAVADRYGVLGTTLLAGATRCDGVDVVPGETERVRCQFDEFDLTLSTYETVATLRTARDVALDTDGSVRSARITEGVAAFVMEETRVGRSRVYWDSTQPRPVSAMASRDNMDLPDLVTWWDGRGFTALTRPEVALLPKDAFESDELRDFAKRFLSASGARCESETPGDGEQEEVFCTWDNGVATLFHLASDRDAFEYTRQAFLVDRVAVPGTFLRLPEGWFYREEPAVKQGEYSQYLSERDNSAVIYFDQDSTLCWALMNAPSSDLQRLGEFWTNGR